MTIKFFEPLASMVPTLCADCQEPVTTVADGVLVQDCVPGGASSIVHHSCLDKIMEED